jgi:hypothetical protein
MPKTIEELIAWLEANPNQRISQLDDNMYDCIDTWRNAVANNTTSSVEIANPKQLLSYIKAARHIAGDEILADIQRTFDES